MEGLIELNQASIRDSIDVQSLFQLLQDARQLAKHSYSASMKFEFRGNSEYLIVRSSGSKSKRSLGPRNMATEEKFRNYSKGKADVEERISGLTKRLQEFAPIMKARGFSRMPNLTARILKKFNEVGWLGTSLIVIGANALYAYENRASVRVQSDVTATDDLDILFDSRKKLSFAGDVNTRGFIGMLQSVDKSFVRNKAKYSATNKDGYIVDVLEPEDHSKIMTKGPSKLSEFDEDLVAAKTYKWLVSSPKFEGMVFDNKGMPLRMVTLDPRIFALQKLHIAMHDKLREHQRRTRDKLQAKISAHIATKYLGLKFDSEELKGLPASVKVLIKELTEGGHDQP